MIFKKVFYIKYLKDNIYIYLIMMTKIPNQYPILTKSVSTKWKIFFIFHFPLMVNYFFINALINNGLWVQYYFTEDYRRKNWKNTIIFSLVSVAAKKRSVLGRRTQLFSICLSSSIFSHAWNPEISRLL